MYCLPIANSQSFIFFFQDENSGASKDYTYGVLGIKYSFALELRDKGTFWFPFTCFSDYPNRNGNVRGHQSRG